MREEVCGVFLSHEYFRTTILSHEYFRTTFDMIPNWAQQTLFPFARLKIEFRYSQDK